jgi:uncharacterized membrane protein YdjX (TVP38/TMEM64 family)
VSEQSGTTAKRAPNSGGARSGRWRPVVLLLAIVGILVLSHLLGLGDRLGDLRAWIASLGAWGPVVFVLIYLVATVAAVPGSALTLAAGALFGPVVGVIVVAIGANLGASGAFLVSRYFARDATARWLGKSDKFRRLDELTERHGAVMVAFTRLVPLFPFNLLNYGFGLTRVRFGTYVLWTALCMLPGITLFVVGAAAVTDAVASGEIPVVAIGVVLAVAAALAVVSRRIRTKLEASATQQPAEDE